MDNKEPKNAEPLEDSRQLSVSVISECLKGPSQSVRVDSSKQSDSLLKREKED